MTLPRILHPALHCDTAPAHRGHVAAMGNMDGVHLGHQALLAAAKAQAGPAPLAAIVFDPHPRAVFQPDAPPFLLTDLETKAALMGVQGVQTLFVLPFVPDLYQQSPAQFVSTTLKQRLGLVGIVTGQDFQFGAGRAGDAGALKALAEREGMQAHAITPVDAPSGIKYSSSTIRQALRDGDPALAAAHLGRPWTVRGTVVEGRRLARTLDFPTANLSLGDYLHPQYGVYVISAQIDGQTRKGVANIGIRPTVDGTAPMVEAHFFDLDQDLYGQSLEVALHHFLRAEQKFDGLDALKAQISKDAAAARAWGPA